MVASIARLLCASLALLLCAGNLRAADDFQAIFNGQDLTDWDGDPRFWSVRDGVIRGETKLQALTTGNTFLIWRGGKVSDFELRLHFRIRNGNSGVQYRSRDLGKWVVSGYQAEIENKPGKVGFLYDEKGRKYLANVGEIVECSVDGQRRVIGRLGSKQDFIDRGYYRKKDWNEYRIVARGERIEHWLNGHRTIELTDRDPRAGARDGVLALQIHSGPPMLVEFKNIRLKSL